MPNNEMKVNFGGQEVTIDRKRLDELAAALGLTADSASTENLAETFSESGLVEWVPAVEPEPIA